MHLVKRRDRAEGLFQYGADLPVREGFEIDKADIPPERSDDLDVGEFRLDPSVPKDAEDYLVGFGDRFSVKVRIDQRFEEVFELAALAAGIFPDFWDAQPE